VTGTFAASWLRVLKRQKTNAPKATLENLALRMTRLLLLLEEESFADARECPFCEAPAEFDEPDSLPHAAGCELHAVLREARLRGLVVETNQDFFPVSRKISVSTSRR